MSRTRFRVNLQFVTQTSYPNWPNYWAVLWVRICTGHFTVCSYYTTYVSERIHTQGAPCSKQARFLKVKRLRARNRWMFVYELNSCGFESRCSHLIFRNRACFEQGVPWQSGNYKVWILKRVRDIMRTYSQMHCSDKYSQHSSII